MIPIIVAKFGGSAVGVDGILIPEIINRLKQMMEKAKVVAVFLLHSSLMKRSQNL